MLDQPYLIPAMAIAIVVGIMLGIGFAELTDVPRLAAGLVTGLVVGASIPLWQRILRSVLG